MGSFYDHRASVFDQSPQQASACEKKSMTDTFKQAIALPKVKKRRVGKSTFITRIDKSVRQSSMQSQISSYVHDTDRHSMVDDGPAFITCMPRDTVSNMRLPPILSNHSSVKLMSPKPKKPVTCSAAVAAFDDQIYDASRDLRKQKQ